MATAPWISSPCHARDLASVGPMKGMQVVGQHRCLGFAVFDVPNRDGAAGRRATWALLARGAATLVLQANVLRRVQVWLWGSARTVKSGRMVHVAAAPRPGRQKPIDVSWDQIPAPVAA